MQTLQLHKKSKPTNQKVVEKKQAEEIVNLREVRGATLATSRRIYRIRNSDAYYFQSERSEEIYYFVRYNPDVFEWCSCPDNSIRGQTCKHIFGIIAAINKETIVDVNKLPKEVKKDDMIPKTKSYRDDDYDF
jgi:hypothetical protein